MIHMAGGREYSPGKLTELVLYIANRAVNDPTFGRVKLNKILWYSDFEAFRVRGESITGARYQNLAEGPALLAMVPLMRELTEKGDIREVAGGAGPKHLRPMALRVEDLGEFSAAEIAIVSDFIAQFWAKPASEVSLVSHDTKAWRLTERQQEIPYGMVVLSEEEPTEADLAWLSEVAGAGLGA